MIHNIYLHTRRPFISCFDWNKLWNLSSDRICKIRQRAKIYVPLTKETSVWVNIMSLALVTKLVASCFFNFYFSQLSVSFHINFSVRKNIIKHFKLSNLLLNTSSSKFVKFSPVDCYHGSWKWKFPRLSVLLNIQCKVGSF